MATYTELRGLFSHAGLLNQIEVACIVAAHEIRTEDPGVDNHVNRMLWAKAAFVSTSTVRNHVLMALLAANKALDPSAITGASDASIQSLVDGVVDLFADGS